MDIAKLSSHELTNYRRDDVGFVFQFYNLVANLTAKENVELAAEIVKDALEEVLEQVGLGHRINNFLLSFQVVSNNGLPLPVLLPKA